MRGTFAGEHGFVDFGSEVVAEFFKSRDIGTSPVSGDSHDWFLSGVCPLAPRIVLVQVPFKKLQGEEGYRARVGNYRILYTIDNGVFFLHRGPS